MEPESRARIFRSFSAVAILVLGALGLLLVGNSAPPQALALELPTTSTVTLPEITLPTLPITTLPTIPSTTVTTQVTSSTTLMTSTTRPASSPTSVPGSSIPDGPTTTNVTSDQIGVPPREGSGSTTTAGSTTTRGTSETVGTPQAESLPPATDHLWDAALALLRPVLPPAIAEVLLSPLLVLEVVLEAMLGSSSALLLPVAALGGLAGWAVWKWSPSIDNYPRTRSTPTGFLDGWDPLATSRFLPPAPDL